MRLANELIRPGVVRFLDQMLRDTNRNLRIEDIPVTPGSSLAGQEVAVLKLHEYGTGLLLLAVRTPEGEYLFNPPATTRVQPGSHLIAMGDPVSVQHLRAVAAPGSAYGLTAGCLWSGLREAGAAGSAVRSPAA